MTNTAGGIPAFFICYTYDNARKRLQTYIIYDILIIIGGDNCG